MTKPSAGTSGEPSSAPTGTNAAARFRWTAAWALAAIVVFTHVLGAGPFTTTLWGANVYAFLPRWALPIALALLAVSLIAAGRSSAPLDRALGSLPAPATRLRMALLMAASFAAFWIFREGHTLLGDGSPLTRSIPLGQRFHPYQPLTVLAHHGFYSLVHGLFASPGQDPREIARSTVALSSALAGALFMPTAWALANEIARAVTPDPAPPAAGAVAVAPWIFLVLLVQGYVQLFFGYVENYTFSALVSSVYLLASLRYLRGASPLALAGMALVLDVGLDLSSVILVPSFVVLVVVGLMRRGGWPAVLRDLAIAGLLGAEIGRAHV